MDKTNEVNTINKKWKSIVEGVDADGESLGLPEIKEHFKKRDVARLLENTEKESISESNTTTGVDNADPILIDLVRRTAPNLLAYDLVGVQPMTGPTGLIFAMRAHRGAQPKAPFGRPGDARPGFEQGAPVDSNGETTAQQWGDAGQAPNEAFYNEPDATFSGKGTQTGHDVAPDYDAYSVGEPFSTVYGESLGGSNSGDGAWNEMSITIEKTNVKSLLVKINKEANLIAKDTRRGRGNFIICSSDVASVLDLTGKLDYAPAIDNNLTVDDTGNTFVGVLQGRFRVYIDPFLGYDEIIVGYKGASQMDAGFFYCPYVPLQMYKAQDPQTFQPKMAFKTRYGTVSNPFTTMKLNNNTYYRKFVVKSL